VSFLQTFMTELRRTPLYQQSIELNGRMTAFAGWEMPVQFSGLSAEHQAVRTNAGMFDISHMGKFLSPNPQSIELLQSLVPSDLSKLQVGQAQYTVLLNPEGGVIDDIIVYLEAAGQVTLIVNASTKDVDLAWIKKAIPDLQDLSADLALIAVQGPAAVAKLQQFVADDISQLPNFGHRRSTIFNAPAFIARTGYTGEDGCEVMLPPTEAVQLWQALIQAGVLPCGLGARDTLRLEAAMCLYGQELNTTISPLEAGLSWLVHLDKGEFIGRDVLVKQKEQGLSRRLVGLELDGRYIARHDYPIHHQGQTVGIVTSGTLSPTLNKPIALGFVPAALSKLGQELEIEIRGKLYPAKVVKKPFYKAKR
jgi:aminomethyltransferase